MISKELREKRARKAKIKREKNEKKIAKKIEKIKQNEIKKFWRKIKIPKNATKEQINECVIAFVSNLPAKYEHFGKIALTEEQWSDANFMLTFYKANPELTLKKEFDSSNIILQKNNDFMFEYIKLAYKEASLITTSNQSIDWVSFDLERILKKYPVAIKSQELINRIANEFTEVNLITVLKNSIIVDWATFEANVIEKEKNDFCNVIANLPTEALVREAKKYGNKAICYLPKHTPNIEKIIGAGIENDGFLSLEKLDIEKVLDNKDLIIKAYEKDGVEALYNYLNKTIAPLRSEYYVCHGQEHEYTHVDARYEKVQRILKNDPEIREIFKNEAKKGRPKTFTKNGITYEYLSK